MATLSGECSARRDRTGNIVSSGLIPSSAFWIVSLDEGAESVQGGVHGESFDGFDETTRWLRVCARVSKDSAGLGVAGRLTYGQAPEGAAPRRWANGSDYSGHAWSECDER